MKSFLFIGSIVAYENSLLLRDRHQVIHKYYEILVKKESILDIIHTE